MHADHHLRPDGACSDSASRLSRLSGFPHHGQSVRGNGEGGVREGLFLYSVIVSATSFSVFAVAERPTHSPTAKRVWPSRESDGAELLEGADQRRRAAELIEREEAQRVAEEHRHAEAAVGPRRAPQPPEQERGRR